MAVAEELVAEGVHVAICARHPDELEAAAEKLRGCGGTVYAQVTDVTDAAQITDLVARSVETLGGLDILVNNAGAAHPGNFESLTDEDWRADLDVKLFSQIRCTRAALAHLRQQQDGTRHQHQLGVCALSRPHVLRHHGEPRSVSQLHQGAGTRAGT